MAIQTSALFKGFSGNIDRQLLFWQCGGKTIVSKFPDRSAVIYSEKQKQERIRFADAVSFARVAIAECMSDQPLQVKKKKSPFYRSQINYPADSEIKIKLFKTVEEQPRVLVKIPIRSRDIAKYRRDRTEYEWGGGTARTARSRWARSCSA